MPYLRTSYVISSKVRMIADIAYEVKIQERRKMDIERLPVINCLPIAQGSPLTVTPLGPEVRKPYIYYSYIYTYFASSDIFARSPSDPARLRTSFPSYNDV